MNKSAIQYADYSWNPVTGCAPGLSCASRCWAAAMHRRFHPGEDFWTPREHPERLDAPLRTRKPGVVAVAFGGDLFAEGVSDEFIWRVLASCVLSGAFARGHTFLILTKRPERMASLLTTSGHTFIGEAACRAFGDENSCHAYNSMTECLGNGHNVGFPPRNVLLGTSVSTQAEADERIPHLMGLAAAGWRTWASVEPMLGPVDLRRWLRMGQFCECDKDRTRGVHDRCGDGWVRCNAGTHRLSWVVCGGESGPGARSMHPYWVRSLRDQCEAAGVPFMLKQWGAWAPLCDYYEEDDAIREATLDQPHALLTPEGWTHNIDLEGQPRVGTWIMGRLGDLNGMPDGEGHTVAQVAIGHKAALLPMLDGRTHSAMPEVR